VPHPKQRSGCATGIDRVLRCANYVLRGVVCVCVEERTAGALWAIVGNNIEERLIMAERMSVRLLVDFVNSSSLLLNLIGAEGLFALASGPLGQHDNIAYGSGVPALIYLIRKPPPDKLAVIAGRPVSC